MDGSRWVRYQGRRFFLPVRVLRHVFRGKVLDLLRQAFLKGELSFHGRLKSLAQERNFRRLLASTKRNPGWFTPSRLSAVPRSSQITLVEVDPPLSASVGPDALERRKRSDHLSQSGLSSDEKYLGRKQRVRGAVNDGIGIEPTR